MSFFKPKFLLLALCGACFPALWTSGCSGAAFTASGDMAGSGTAGSTGSGGDSGNAAGEGSGASSNAHCAGPEDCNDKDPCTVDRCNADGTCDTAPKCAGTEKCCGGDCAECCDDSDCTAGASCTKPTCFSGQCMYVPDDTKCEPAQYCSAKDGCRAKQVCGVLAGEAADVCADSSDCTVDSCVDNFCEHRFCNDPKASLCCEGKGCAACCNDSQCDTDNDPCTVGSCTDGQCSVVKLCGDGQECCPSADGKTATCGSCCSAAECDDKVACTKDQCNGGQCSHTPGTCEVAGLVCDPLKGCQKAPACMGDSDCKPSGCQSNPKCSSGACQFGGCATGTKCCGAAGSTAACKVCCDNSECNDNIACTVDTCTANGCTHTVDNTLCTNNQKCDAQFGCVACKKAADCDDGLSCTTDTCNPDTHTCSNLSTCSKPQYCTANGCSECVSDSDCQGVIVSANAILPIGDCSVSTCVKGQCQTTTTTCGDLQTCCPPYGCQIRCLQTQ